MAGSKFLSARPDWAHFNALSLQKRTHIVSNSADRNNMKLCEEVRNRHGAKPPPTREWKRARGSLRW